MDEEDPQRRLGLFEIYGILLVRADFFLAFQSSSSWSVLHF